VLLVEMTGAASAGRHPVRLDLRCLAIPAPTHWHLPAGVWPNARRLESGVSLIWDFDG